MAAKVSEVERIRSAWRRVTTWLAADFPEGYALLSPGASDQDLQTLAIAIGRQVPDGLAELLRANNGQQVEDDPGLFGGWSFLSTSRIAREWKDWEGIRAIGKPSLLYASSYTSEPPDAIEETYTSGGWIPLAKEPMEGNYIGLDFSPGPAGLAGQVINFGRDEGEKWVLAPGIPELLEWLADRCESGGIAIRRVDDRFVLSCDGERLSAALIEACAGG